MTRPPVRSILSSKEEALIVQQVLQEKAMDEDGAVLRCEYPGDDMEPDLTTAEHYRKRSAILRVAAKILRHELITLHGISLEALREAYK